MAKKKNEPVELISQDGISDWNPEFFIGLTEKEALEKMRKGSPHIKDSTTISVWKQANGKSKPNPKSEGEK